MAARIPTFNGLVTELYDLSRGTGLAIGTIEKMNHKSHLIAALDLGLTGSGLDQANALRKGLVAIIADSKNLSDQSKLVLSYKLNWDDKAAFAGLKLGARQADLGVVLRCGKKKREAAERTAVRVLANELLSMSKERS